MFGFFLYGIYASDISKAFFPVKSGYVSLMLTFVTFGAGFLMRPLGAIVLGAYIDRLVPRGCRAADPGLLGGRGAGRRVGLSVGNGDAGPQGLLRQLAVGQPAGRD